MKNIQDYYRDQAMSSVVFGDRRISSAFLPHDIRCMDTDFGVRIRNVYNKVKAVYERDRVHPIRIDTRGKSYKSVTECVTVYEERDISNCRFGFGVKVIWTTPGGWDVEHKFYYDVIPTFNQKIRRETKKQIAADIKNNPHLHKKIKANLLLNLKNIRR